MVTSLEHFGMVLIIYEIRNWVVFLFNLPPVVSAVFRLWASTIGSVVIPRSSLKLWNDTSRQMNFHWSYNKQSLVGSKWGEHVSLLCCASMLKTLLTPHLDFLNILLHYERISCCLSEVVVAHISAKRSSQDLGSWMPVWSLLLWNNTSSMLLTAVLLLGVNTQWTLWLTSTMLLCFFFYLFLYQLNDFLAWMFSKKIIVKAVNKLSTFTPFKPHCSQNISNLDILSFTSSWRLSVNYYTR